MLFNILQTGAEMTEAIEAVPVQQVANFSLIDLAVKGGWLMIVLLILSIIAIYLFGKKWWMINQASKIDKNFMNDIRDYIHEGKIQSAQALCTHYDTPVARMVEAGIVILNMNSAWRSQPAYRLRRWT